MTKLIDKLRSAGLDSEECPMMDCFGHLNLNESAGFFKCSICGEVFPLNETLRQWHRTNKELTALVDLWEKEEQAEANELEWLLEDF